jgi:hypothetical protein
LAEVAFASDSNLRKIDGFCDCTSLCRIDIPSSVEIIFCPGFSKCRSLADVVLASDSHLREIAGFCDCASLCYISIPPSGTSGSCARFSISLYRISRSRRSWRLPRPIQPRPARRCFLLASAAISALSARLPFRPIDQNLAMLSYMDDTIRTLLQPAGNPFTN